MTIWMGFDSSCHQCSNPEKAREDTGATERPCQQDKRVIFQEWIVNISYILQINRYFALNNAAVFSIDMKYGSSS